MLPSPSSRYILLFSHLISVSTIFQSTSLLGRTVRPNVIPLTLTFSANTNANMTQDLLDSKMDKRRKGVFGPASGKKYYVYVDGKILCKMEGFIIS